MLYIQSLSHGCDKMPDKGHSRKRRFVPVPVRVQSTVERKRWPPELEETVWTVSTVPVTNAPFASSLFRPQLS